MSDNSRKDSSHCHVATTGDDVEGALLVLSYHKPPKRQQMSSLSLQNRHYSMSKRHNSGRKRKREKVLQKFAYFRAQTLTAPTATPPCLITSNDTFIWFNVYIQERKHVGREEHETRAIFNETFHDFAFCFFPRNNKHTQPHSVA